jgi:exo-1,4-beta-D-glucosaminidase
MNGPYDWVPPAYWETDSNKHGGSWSFATEISPGPSICLTKVCQVYSKDSIGNTTGDWLYHCGTFQFSTTKILTSRLGTTLWRSHLPSGLFAKAQLQNYEGHRAMMEAYGLDKV